MKNAKSFLAPFRAIALIAFFCLASASAHAQTPTPSEPVYIQREFMKVLPGMNADYLKVEQVWKTVHQRRKDEGKILGWTLYRSIYPSGTNSAYDYMTSTRFKNGNDIADSNSMTWDYITKGMGKEDLDVANNTGKTRNLVSTSLYYMMESASPGAGFLKLTHLSAQSGKGGELEKLEKMMKPVFEEAIKTGKIATWTFGSKMYPYSSETGNYYRVIGTNSLEQMLESDNTNYIEAAFKKVYPNKDYAATMKSFRDIIEIHSSELWVKVDETK
jgi:hypothetical protein